MAQNWDTVELKDLGLFFFILFEHIVSYFLVKKSVGLMTTHDHGTTWKIVEVSRTQKKFVWMCINVSI